MCVLCFNAIVYKQPEIQAVTFYKVKANDFISIANI
jgi:hypothetical protein